MDSLLTIEQRNNVLLSMAKLVEKEREQLLKINKIDLEQYSGNDLAMEDRLKVDHAKIDGMIDSLEHLASQEDPLGVERFAFRHENGMQVYNKTAPFGSIMIIYESRPDVTIEAAGIAFKSGNRILLKGGKESLNSNLKITELWYQALAEHNISRDWVKYLNFNRQETQAFLERPTEKVDLIVPRGGEKLIAFVKQNATCPVIVSGRGNNFVYVDKEADLDMAVDVILNAKTAKVSACNAVDKVLIDSRLPERESFIPHLLDKLTGHDIEILAGPEILANSNSSESAANTSTAVATKVSVKAIPSEDTWYEEFLDYKILLGEVSSTEEAIEKINKYSGGHSSSIISKNDQTAAAFMENIDSAAVYHNASTRFTDGSQVGLGGELAISTDKLHQRGPIGLQHLVTNKWYIHGNGQIR